MLNQEVLIALFTCNNGDSRRRSQRHLHYQHRQLTTCSGIGVKPACQ